MNLYPAIDILDGSAVRLVQGDFEHETVFDEDPSRRARLDASGRERSARRRSRRRARGRAGEPRAPAVGSRPSPACPCSIGGGLRSRAAVDDALAAGAARGRPRHCRVHRAELLEQALAGTAIACSSSVDVRGGHVATARLDRDHAGCGCEACASLVERAASNFVYTDVDRATGCSKVPTCEDDWVAGAAAAASVIYSGGIGALA